MVVLRPRWHFWATIALGTFAVGVALFVHVTVAYALNGEPVWQFYFRNPWSALHVAFLIGVGVFLFWSAVDGRRRPEKLVLGDEGLTVRTADRTRFVRWSDIKAFRVEAPRGGGPVVLGWDHHDDALEGAPRWEGSFLEGNRKRATTHDVQLDARWSLAPEALCDLLESWRCRRVQNVGGDANDAPAARSSLT